MDELEGIPCRILGHQITTRTQILVSCVIPASLELIVYLLVTASDIGVIVQHYRDSNRIYGGLTLFFLLLPAVGCFCSIIVSPWQWPKYDDDNGTLYCGKTNLLFFLKQLYNLFLFPIAATYRLTRRIFWSVDALFHQRDSYERHHSVAKAAQTSSFELYHFLQAFLQAAPQIILQFYIILREDQFRNYETTHVQVMSIVTSLIIMAIVAESYQRFESQKVVGRNYPWATQNQCVCRKKIFQRTTSQLDHQGQSTTQTTQAINYVVLPESEHIMRRFQSVDPSRHSIAVHSDCDDCVVFFDEPINNNELTRPSQLSSLSSTTSPLPAAAASLRERQTNVDDTFLNHQNNKSLKLGEFNLNTSNNLSETENDIQKLSSSIDIVGDNNRNQFDFNIRPQSLHFNVVGQQPPRSPEQPVPLDQLDFSPDLPPPPPPDYAQAMLNRISLFKDKWILNAELYIKDNVPRLPTSVLNHIERTEKKLQNTEIVGVVVSATNDRGCTNNQPQSQSPSLNAPSPIPLLMTSTSYDGQDSTPPPPPLRTLPTIASAPPSPIQTTPKPNNGHDEIDFIMPTKKKIIQGIEQDDFVGKSVLFTAWILFLYQRMLALSTFCFFYPWECFYLCLAHYLLVIILLFLETRFHDKLERLAFYLFLAYIYIFCILEFKIKFKNPRYWICGYIICVTVQNFVITLIWYYRKEFESWWFEYIFGAIILSLIYSIMCLLVYYFILKPADKVLFENDE